MAHKNLASTSLAAISATIIEILSAIANKYPTAFIDVFPILPRFDHCYSDIYFQVQECFSERVFSGSITFPMQQEYVQGPQNPRDQQGK